MSLAQLTAQTESRKAKTGQEQSIPQQAEMITEIWKNTQKQERSDGPNPVQQLLEAMVESLIQISRDQERLEEGQREIKEILSRLTSKEMSR